MTDETYIAHDATAENGGVPVWNVKGPGNFDRLVVGKPWEAAGTKLRATLYAADLTEAFRLGRRMAELRAKSGGGEA